MNSDTIIRQKKIMRRELAAKSFDEKLAILIRLQRMACEMAEASGRKFKGTIWGDSSLSHGFSVKHG